MVLLARAFGARSSAINLRYICRVPRGRAVEKLKKKKKEKWKRNVKRATIWRKK